MRLSSILLLATAISCLVNSNAALITGTVDQNSIRMTDDSGLVNDIIQSNGNENRFLRTREAVDEDSDDVGEGSDYEERATLDRLVSDLSGNAVGAVKKLPRSKSFTASNPIEDVEVLEKFLTFLKGKNNKLFKYIHEEMKVNKVTMRDMLDLPKKMKTMSMEQLAEDKNFLLWIHFKRYIDQSH